MVFPPLQDLQQKQYTPTFSSIPYFQNPYKGLDNEHGVNKIATISALSGYGGLCIGLIDALGRTKSPTWAAFAMRTASIAVPAAMMGAAFATTTVVTAGIRGKSDPKNHFVGGCAAGAVLGVRVKSVRAGIGFALGLGTLAFVFRGLELEGGLEGLIPKRYRDGPRPIQGGIWNWKTTYDPLRKEPNRDIDH